MAASPLSMEGGGLSQKNWGPPDDQDMGLPGSETDPSNGAGPLPADDSIAKDIENPDYTRGSSVGDVSRSGGKHDTSYREKQVKVLRSLPVCLLECLHRT